MHLSKFWRIGGITFWAIIIGCVLIFYWDYTGLKISPENNLFAQITPSDCSNLETRDVHIAYVTDANYLYPTQVSLYSAIQNKCPQSIYHFHIATDNVDLKQAESYFRPFEKSDVNIEIVQMNGAYKRKFPKFLKHISATAIVKVSLPEALPEVDKLIYLDSDTLVTKDLQELYTTELEEPFIAGAVEDIGVVSQKEYLEKLGFKEPFYYNAGMFLFNLKQMRKEKISKMLIAYIKGIKKLWFLEQDAYNMVLQKSIKRLHYKYNTAAILHIEVNETPVIFAEYLKKRLTGRTWEGSNFLRLHADELPFFYRNIFKDTVMLHYFGPSKPWRDPPDCIQRELYYNFWKSYADRMAEYLDSKTQAP